MIDYLLKYHDKLLKALIEHIEIVLVVILLSIIIASLLTTVSMLIERLQKYFLGIFSAIYSIPSLAFFALLIPLTGLGKFTAIIVLVLYNQYILLGNFISGLNEVDSSVVEAATGMGMTKFQVLYKIRIPLSKSILLTGIRLAIVSTVGIATIAACINAGGLGSILFDGLRTQNVYKILWGSILSALLALGLNGLLGFAEKKLAEPETKYHKKGIGF